MLAAPDLMSRSERDTFVGREHELARLDALFAEGHRLVAIVGGPAVGKSRLAARWARGRRDVVVVQLASTRTAEEIAVAMAHALRLRDSSLALGPVDADDLDHRVDAALEVGEAELLVLDDAEGALEPLAERVARWLELAPALRILVSTRQALRLRSERAIEIGGLELPSDDSVEAVAASDAARLLAARAVGISIDERGAATIARIVRSVDGNPLAIELAAARLSSLGLSDVAERIAGGLELLDRAPRDAAARHASLRRAIDVSWALSTDAERALLARCAPFRGWFDVDAVEAMMEDVVADPLDALHGARERSMIVMVAAGDRSRYALSAPVRAFAAEELERMGGGDEARHRHARWLVRRASAAAERWRTAADEDALAFLREHQADLAAALETAASDVRASLLLAFDPLLARRERPDAHAAALRAPLARALPVELGVELRIALASALERAGRVDEGLSHLETAREAAPNVNDLAARIEVTAGQLHQTSGRLDDARTAFARGLDRAEHVETRVRALRGLGLVAHARGDLDEAEERYREALRSAAEVPLLEARLSCDLGSVRLQQRRLDEAREHLERALARSERASDPITVGLTEGNLAILAQEQGRLDDAASAFERALTSLAHAGHSLYEAHLGLYLGFLEHERGAIERAVARYERALRALESIGDRRMAGVAYAGLGAAEAQRGRLDAARDAFARSERAIAGIGDTGIALALELHRAQLALSEAEVATDPTEAGALRERAGSALRAAQPEQLDRSDDARLAARLLRVRLERRTLRVRRDGAELRAPDGTDVDLASREVLRRLVLALARARDERPGEPISVETLVLEGWPGERMRWESALNRFKVALSTLRKLGLKELIVRRDDGYLLDPAVGFAWWDEP